VSNRFGLTAAVAALCILGIGSGSSAFAQAPECSGKNAKISKKIAKPVQGAIDSLNAQKFQETLTKASEAEADPAPKALYDTYIIANLKGKAYTGLKQYADAAKEFETVIGTPCLTDLERGEFLRLMTKIYYQLDNDAKVIEHGTKAVTMTGDPDLPLYLGQAYYRMKDYANSRKVMEGVVAKLEEQGKPPGEQNLRLIHGACVSLDDEACQTTQFEKLVRHYPKPEYWENLVNTLFNDKKSTDKQQLNIMRLATHVGAVKEPLKYEECAQIAIALGLPGEAQSLLEEGFNKKYIVEPRQVERDKKLLAEAKAAAAGDKATLAQQENSAKANAAGNADVKLGAAYLSYGDNAKAIEALQRGIGKGSVRDSDEAGILLGIAYLRSGNKEEAAKAFNTVKTDATMTRIAKLWLLTTGTSPAAVASK
jgi:tetratricopeptide (TPR) repeat protein